MREYKWIAKSGQCDLNSLRSLLTQETDNKEYFYIAMMTNQFAAGRLESGNPDKIMDDRLLELRIFNEEREILATRGMIGSDFQWRITSDEAIEEGDVITSEQFIDINDNMAFEMNEDGNRILFSTVGGAYVLPITESQKKVKVKNYISYDHNGMAKVVDSRVCCFTE